MVLSPRLFRRIPRRARATDARYKLEDELRNEIRFYLEMRTEELIAEGMDSEEAKLAAERAPCPHVPSRPLATPPVEKSRLEAEDLPDSHFDLVKVAARDVADALLELAFVNRAERFALGEAVGLQAGHIGRLGQGNPERTGLGRQWDQQNIGAKVVNGVDADHQGRSRFREAGGLDNPDISSPDPLRGVAHSDHIASATISSQASRSRRSSSSS